MCNYMEWSDIIGNNSYWGEGLIHRDSSNLLSSLDANEFRGNFPPKQTRPKTKTLKPLILLTLGSCRPS